MVGLGWGGGWQVHGEGAGSQSPGTRGGQDAGGHPQGSRGRSEPHINAPRRAQRGFSAREPGSESWGLRTRTRTRGHLVVPGLMVPITALQAPPTQPGRPLPQTPWPLDLIHCHLRQAGSLHSQERRPRPGQVGGPHCRGRGSGELASSGVGRPTSRTRPRSLWPARPLGTGLWSLPGPGPRIPQAAPPGQLSG